MSFPTDNGKYKGKHHLHNDSLGRPKKALDQRKTFAQRLVDEENATKILQRIAGKIRNLDCNIIELLQSHFGLTCLA